MSENVGCAVGYSTCFFSYFTYYFVEFFDIWFGEGDRIICVGNAGFDNCVNDVYFLF